jgi:hypothetical protein
VTVLASLLAAALLAGSTPDGGAAPAPAAAPAKGAARRAQQRPRSAHLEAVRGDAAGAPARAAFGDALQRHLRRLGFQVVEGKRPAAYRLQPALLVVDTAQEGGSVSLEVKASLVAFDRKGHVAAMVEGGARARGAAAQTPATSLEAQALEAAARSLAEDLARRLLEAR